MLRFALRNGYVFLVSMLVIGTIAAAASVTLLLLGWTAEQNGELHVQSAQSGELASTCVERAVHKLQLDLSYAGNETISDTQPFGTCKIYNVGGTVGSNFDRTICVQGFSRNGSQRLQQVYLSRVFPKTSISTWDEVQCCTAGGALAPNCGSSSSSNSSSSSSSSSQSSSNSSQSSSVGGGMGGNIG